jgi:hypothetical protein
MIGVMLLRCEECGKEARTAEEARGWRTFMFVVVEVNRQSRSTTAPIAPTGNSRTTAVEAPAPDAPAVGRFCAARRRANSKRATLAGVGWVAVEEPLDVSALDRLVTLCLVPDLLGVASCLRQFGELGLRPFSPSQDPTPHARNDTSAAPARRRFCAARWRKSLT